MMMVQMMVLWCVICDGGAGDGDGVVCDGGAGDSDGVVCDDGAGDGVMVCGVSEHLHFSFLPRCFHISVSSWDLSPLRKRAVPRVAWCYGV